LHSRCSGGILQHRGARQNPAARWQNRAGRECGGYRAGGIWYYAGGSVQAMCS